MRSFCIQTGHLDSDLQNQTKIKLELFDETDHLVKTYVVTVSDIHTVYANRIEERIHERLSGLDREVLSVTPATLAVILQQGLAGNASVETLFPE